MEAITLLKCCFPLFVLFFLGKVSLVVRVGPESVAISPQTPSSGVTDARLASGLKIFFKVVLDFLKCV